MKILLTADPEIPVPPRFYGGIERIVEFLVQGLVEKGHNVTLMAHYDSSVGCTKLLPYSGKTSRSSLDTLNNIYALFKEITTTRYDLIHSFGRLAYLIPALPSNIPKLMSYQREPTLSGITRAMAISKRNTLFFTGCSDYITSQIKPLAPAFTIFNGVPIHKYDFQPEINNDAPLVFLGRIEHIKGTHLAIDIAKKTGRKLIIAGNIPSDSVAQTYFTEKIAPQIDDQQIQYIGPVDDQQKNMLLGQASAFLMPILWDEPFGIVMAEAMACGTPVLALRRGSVPEIIIDGVNGFTGTTIEDLITAVGKINQIERLICRQVAEKKFSDQAIVSAYEQLYFKLINRSS
ncbi:MAG: glycosyltransferase [Haliscomenobacter sp.]|uniref:glycosyltransferase n=1 Tax=Haliscomenobacter sp. TaxID=2717303 RepID=UPI0029BABD12|nr:glycosyltransferase [Haliscomenobacter sp.]MDX2067868.1 glycosyltransferase [Haliscomenobacter sp.]